MNEWMDGTMDMLDDWIWRNRSDLFCVSLWKAFKLVLRWWTGTHAIERVLRANDELTTWRVYKELLLSTRLLVQRIEVLVPSYESNLDAVSRSILSLKSTPSILRLFSGPLCQSLQHIRSLRRGLQDISMKRSEKVTLREHGPVLEAAWDKVMQGQPQRQWVLMGFQGNDPAADFRGTGKVGLDHFEHFCNEHTLDFRTIIQESKSNTAEAIGGPWYSAALASIHISLLLIQRFEDDEYSRTILVHRRPAIEVLREQHGRQFVRFHQYWKREVYEERVRSVMDFEICFKQFAKTV